MKINKLRFLVILLAAFILISVPGVHAVWTYATGAIAPVIITNTITLGKFDYDSPKGSLDEVFEATLNNTTSFNNLKNEFTNQTVISTKDPNEKALIYSIFGSNPTITFNDQQLSVSDIYIQRANIDGKNTGADGSNEYTLYLVSGDKVYAMTFSGDTGGDWSQLGQMYEGTMTNGDVSSWKVTPGTYKIGDYEYKVGQTNGNPIDQLKTLEQLMTSKDDGIVNSNLNNRNPSDLAKGYIIVAKEYIDDKSFINSTDPEKQLLKNAYNAFKGIKQYISECIVEPHRVVIKISNNAPRAEVITALIAVYELMDSYKSIPYDDWLSNNSPYNMRTFYDNEWSKW